MRMFPTDPRDLRLSLDGFPLYGVDSYGCEWHVTFQDVSGLFDGVASTLRTETKAMTDGWYANLPRLQGRTISIEGHIIGRCTESCIAAWNTFKSVLDPAGMRLVVDFGEIARQTQVLQSESAPLVKWAGVNILKFTIGLKSLDPCLYGLESVSGVSSLPTTHGGMTMPYSFGGSGSASSVWMWNEEVASGHIRLSNAGTAPSPVMIRIDGPVVNPQVLHVGSGHVMAFDMSLGLGHYVTVDGSTHEILIDGSDPARGRVVRREWSQADVGLNDWAFSAGEHSDLARMTVLFYPAYL